MPYLSPLSGIGITLVDCQAMGKQCNGIIKYSADEIKLYRGIKYTIRSQISVGFKFFLNNSNFAYINIVEDERFSIFHILRGHQPDDKFHFGKEVQIKLKYFANASVLAPPLHLSPSLNIVSGLPFVSLVIPLSH